MNDAVPEPALELGISGRDVRVGGLLEPADSIGVEAGTIRVRALKKALLNS